MKEKKYWVYIHLFPNGKRYVGITTARNPQWRWGKEGQHYGRQLLGSKITKYGWDNIQHEVFEVESEEEMYYLEKYFIGYYNTRNYLKGYNNSEGGKKGSLGSRYTRSEEDRKKNSQRNKGKIESLEQREKQAQTMRSLWKDPELRSKWIKSRKETASSTSFRSKMSELSKKRWEDPEYRKRLSEAHKKKKDLDN